MRIAVALAFMFLSSLGFAQQRADLRTKMVGPSQLSVGISGHYDVTIFSKGQVAMPGSYVTIYLPSGASVPAKPSNCNLLTGYRLKCTLGTLPALGNAVPAATLAFDIVAAAPQTWPLKAESKGTMVDHTPADSVATIRLNVTAPVNNSITISAPQNLRFDGCTFQGPPNPAHIFAACGTSSLWGHNGTFAQGAYTVQGESIGNWSQTDPESLRIEFQDDGQPVSAIYTGTAISPSCFEGTGTFPNNQNFHSAFRACLVP